MAQQNWLEMAVAGNAVATDRPGAGQMLTILGRSQWGPCRGGWGLNYKF